jgi:hypothetical protein
VPCVKNWRGFVQRARIDLVRELVFVRAKQPPRAQSAVSALSSAERFESTFKESDQGPTKKY